MSDITPEQAPLIHDIESYKEVTGAKRFKRTKEEMQLGLSPEQALQHRLQEVAGKSQTQGYLDVIRTQHATMRDAPRVVPHVGEIVIKVRPAPGVDRNLFEHLAIGSIELEMDDKWYSWIDELLAARFEKRQPELIEHILNLGIGEVITTYPEENEDDD